MDSESKKKNKIRLTGQKRGIKKKGPPQTSLGSFLSVVFQPELYICTYIYIPLSLAPPKKSFKLSHHAQQRNKAFLFFSFFF